MITNETIQRLRLTNHGNQTLDVEVPGTGENCRLTFKDDQSGVQLVGVFLIQDVVRLGEFLSGKRKK